MSSIIDERPQPEERELGAVLAQVWEEEPEQEEAAFQEEGEEGLHALPAPDARVQDRQGAGVRRIFPQRQWEEVQETSGTVGIQNLN